MLRIKSAEALPGLNVKMTLTDGSVIVRDLSELLTGQVFDQLRVDHNLFSQVAVVDGTLVWPGGLDVCPDMVIYGGPPPAEQDERIAG